MKVWVLAVPLLGVALAGCTQEAPPLDPPPERVSQAAPTCKDDPARVNLTLEEKVQTGSFSVTAAGVWSPSRGNAPRIGTGCDPHNLTLTLTWKADVVGEEWRTWFSWCTNPTGASATGKSPLVLKVAVPKLQPERTCTVWVSPADGSPAVGEVDFQYRLSLWSWEPRDDEQAP